MILFAIKAILQITELLMNLSLNHDENQFLKAAQYLILFIIMASYTNITEPIVKKLFTKPSFPPLPGTAEEKEYFNRLQSGFAAQFQEAFPDAHAVKTVVIVPSLTLDNIMLEKISGHIYYEERMLCMLMLLRMPATHVVYVTSMPVDEVIIDYYLHLLPGITGYHAKKRLTLLSCYDASTKSLTEKMLERPRLIERISNAIPYKQLAHLVCFNVTEHERTLAVQLGLPLYGCDPGLYYWGTKSCSRELFRRCNILMPDGIEHLYTRTSVAEALTTIKKRNPSLCKALIKLNDGFSGEGNAFFSYDGLTTDDELLQKINDQLTNRIKTIAPYLTADTFLKKMVMVGGIAEVFLERVTKTSPSVQCRITPLGEIDIISTHDQLLDKETSQVFLGAFFPANIDYAADIGKTGAIISEALKKEGVLGRFSIDFLSLKENEEWKNYAIEINLRKGGTTHPYLMLQFLTDGCYEANTGLYLTAGNQNRYYFASDNLQSEKYKGLTPHDLIDIAMYHHLLYDATKQEGVMFHLLGALSQYGKLGAVCVGSTLKKAYEYYQKVLDVLELECG